MPIGTRVPTGGAAQPSGPPKPPDPEPMSAREVQLRQAAGSSADQLIAGQLAPVIQQMEEARKAAYAVKLKQWEADLATYKSSQDPVHRANLEKMQVEAAEKAKERAKMDARGGVPQSVIDEKIKESAKVAGPLREASGAINQIEDLLDQGIFTGTLGKVDLAIAKAKQAVGGAVDPRVARTEQFTSSIKPITAAARAALAGGANISDRDLQAAEAAAGGDIIADQGRHPAHHVVAAHHPVADRATSSGHPGNCGWRRHRSGAHAVRPAWPADGKHSFQKPSRRAAPDGECRQRA